MNLSGLKCRLWIAMLALAAMAGCTADKLAEKNYGADIGYGYVEDIPVYYGDDSAPNYDIAPYEDDFGGGGSGGPDEGARW